MHKITNNNLIKVSIKSSDEYFKNNISSFEGETIFVDNLLNKSNVTFKNCSFLLKPEGSIQLSDCEIENCRFFGLKSFDDLLDNKNYLIISRPKKFDSNSISRVFRTISLKDGKVKNLVDHSSTSSKTSLSKLKVYDSFIMGSCNILNIEDFYFSKRTGKSYWNKAISIQANCMNAVFDDTKIDPFFLATKCSNKSTLDITRATLTDDWSRLRKKYAGVSLFIVFILTLFFFLPLITESFFLLLSTKIDSSLVPFNKAPLWKVLLFGNKNGTSAIIYLILTIVLLIYNIGRFWMTISIAKLREEENFLKDSSFQLVSIHPEKYKIQKYVDSILSYLFWISLIYSILKLIDTLKIEVPQIIY